ncbi:MAG: ATP synthase F1 subunit delta [Calditerrivibrio sp.]|nr:ATP synthase F1 subunit delta [Calditerrivibrio sp.]
MVVSKRYAIAIYNSLKSLEDKKNVMDELRKLKNLIDTNPDLEKVIKSPIIKKADKLSAINAVAEVLKLSSEIKSFLILLINKNRLNIFPSVYESFVQFYNDEIGVVEASVVIAEELKEDTLKKIEFKLAEITKKKVLLKVIKDKSIIAGFTAKIKSNLYDASIKGQLDRLTDKLMEI